MFFHVLSCSFMFLHFPSFSFIFLHFPSCSFMFFHVLSCSFMFFHVLSCSFMFFHVPSFSFYFLSFSFIFFYVLSCSFMFFHFSSFFFIFLHVLSFSFMFITAVVLPLPAGPRTAIARRCCCGAGKRDGCARSSGTSSPCSSSPSSSRHHPCCSCRSAIAASARPTTVRTIRNSRAGPVVQSSWKPSSSFLSCVPLVNHAPVRCQHREDVLHVVLPERMQFQIRSDPFRVVPLLGAVRVQPHQRLVLHVVRDQLHFRDPEIVQRSSRAYARGRSPQ